MDTAGKGAFNGHAKRVEINLSAGGGSVVVDGVDLSRFVRDVEIDCILGELPVVNLTIPAIVLEAYAEAERVIGEFVDVGDLKEFREFGNGHS